MSQNLWKSFENLWNEWLFWKDLIVITTVKMNTFIGLNTSLKKGLTTNLQIERTQHPLRLWNWLINLRFGGLIWGVTGIGQDYHSDAAWLGPWALHAATVPEDWREMECVVPLKLGRAGTRRLKLGTSWWKEQGGKYQRWNLFSFHSCFTGLKPKPSSLYIFLYIFIEFIFLFII